MSQTALVAPPVWQRDKERANRVLPEIKRICGEYLIGEAPQEEDAERNTDLIVLRLDPVRIACRVRTYNYLGECNYRNEFTIRTERPAGRKTELAKIIEGYGDYIFYGFADREAQSLAAWVLGDLKVFRLWFNMRIVNDKRLPGFEKANRDGSSIFRAFTIADLGPAFVLARRFASAPGL